MALLHRPRDPPTARGGHVRLLGLVLLTLGVASVLWSVLGAWQAARLSRRRQVEGAPAPSGSFSYQDGPIPPGTMTSRELAETEDD